MEELFLELPYILNAKDAQKILGIFHFSVYALLHQQDFLTLHVNAHRLAPKENLFAWLKQKTDAGFVFELFGPCCHTPQKMYGKPCDEAIYHWLSYRTKA